MKAIFRKWVRPVGGTAILGVLVWRLGTGPFLDGIRLIDARSLAAAAAVALLTTLCCAWRWSVVARGLGVPVPLGRAVAAYYRSQFLNTTLPGGVLGDVHRGVSHGREAGDVGRGLRAVGWERGAGQVVQIGLTLVVLLALASPVRTAMPTVALSLLVAVVVIALVIWLVPHGGTTRWARIRRTAGTDVGRSLLARRTWPVVLLTSLVVVAGHAATFVIAARTAGATVSPGRIVPLALLVLMAMAVPANVGGWGPREGAAAWAFGAAGLGASLGITTAVVYGVMVLVSSLPGAAVLLAAALGGARRNHRDASASRPPAGSRSIPKELVHG